MDVFGPLLPLAGPTLTASRSLDAMFIEELYWGDGREEILGAGYLDGVTLGLARKNGENGALSR